jgi:hypothetical protein
MTLGANIAAVTQWEEAEEFVVVGPGAAAEVNPIHLETLY